MNDILCHYGVLGMKWGVRKDPDKAYAKSSAKLRKLDTKLVKKTAKSNKAEAKMTKAKANATSTRKLRKAQKLEVKYNKKLLKTGKARQKAVKWYNRMESTFADVEVSNMSQDDVDLGKAYAQMIFGEVRTRGGVK